MIKLEIVLSYNLAIIHHIAKIGDFKLLEGILSKDVKIDVINKNKETPLISAINSKNIMIAKSLIDLGADISIKDSCDLTPLMLSCKIGLIDICEYLLNNGANINESNILGDTPLKMAQRFGHEELAIKLIQQYKALMRPQSKK
jgi:26S proteasome non-ATPase regulatory subunit 10